MFHVVVATYNILRAVEEYLASGMFPLLDGFGFGEIADDDTPVSKIVVPLPDYHSKGTLQRNHT
jgi:hypothetical protein